MERNKKVIYTVVLGGYDEISPAPKFEGWDFVVFTDDLSLNADGWYIINIDGDDKKECRKYKFLSHVYLSGYDLVCYIDGNVRLIAEPPSHPIWFTHSKWNC